MPSTNTLVAYYGERVIYNPHIIGPALSYHVVGLNHLIDITPGWARSKVFISDTDN